MEQNYHCTEKEVPYYYRIGMFAQMNKITIKALRHYDEIGLLKPAYVDEHNGYRYYSSSQLQILHRILVLRQIGFRLDEIQQILSGANETGMLLMKKSKLLQSVSDLTQKIAAIEGYLAKEDTVSAYHPIIKSLPKVKCASMRVQLDSYQDLFTYMPKMGEAMEKAGCICAEPDYCFTCYHDGGYKANKVDAEIFQAVTAMQDDMQDLHFVELSEVEQAVCVLHKGSYETLPYAYQALIAYMEEHGYMAAGEPREVYIDGVWNKDTSAQWLTELQFPIKQE